MTVELVGVLDLLLSIRIFHPFNSALRSLTYNVYSGLFPYLCYAHFRMKCSNTRVLGVHKGDLPAVFHLQVG